MARSPQTAGLVPSRVTIPVAANTLIERGMIVQKDSNHRGVPGDDSNGLPAFGVALHTVDNRTGGPFGGAAGAVEVEVDCGLVGVSYTSNVVAGDVVYVSGPYEVTDAAEDNGGAGVCHEIRDGLAWVWMNPVMGGLVNEIIAIRAEIAAL